MKFQELFEAAVGPSATPYAYQERLAREGLPDVLRAPTGAGKTLGATLPWLYRRRFHPDPTVHDDTPHWLIFALPMRVLVEQTADVVRGVVNSVGLQHEVPVEVVLGGMGRLASGWQERPEQDRIIIGTIDLLLSRALNRGYATSRWSWPIDFGLLNAGCQWVFDEVQLMGPSLPTSRQLEGLRRRFGTAGGCRSMWMSATLAEGELATVDLADVGIVVELSDDDRAGPLGKRLAATKRIRGLQAGTDPKEYPARVTASVLAHHRPGTRTIAILNTVERARQVYEAFASAGAGVELVLLHSRFRSGDRRRQVESALGEIDPDSPGRIVVTTQVLEAGVDVTSATLFTEAARWSSVVQRSGRCNRDGEAADATLLWSIPPDPAPYEASDIEATARVLEDLDGQAMTPPQLGARRVEMTRPVHPVLRAKDLMELFDTTPDLSGNDIDISRYIRDSKDLDVVVAWRAFAEIGPPEGEPAPAASELCPVPVWQAADAVKTRRAWRFDHIEEAWVRVYAADIRPGQILLMRSEEGGYTERTGWDPRSKTHVEALPGDAVDADLATGADPRSFIGRWVTLVEHLRDVEAEAAVIGDAVRLNERQRQALVAAARHHDIGKSHPVFQRTLLNTEDETDREARRAGGPWAKSNRLGGRHERRHFRHELVSALALLGIDMDDGDLVRYLVAAHHGRVRLGIRSLPDERPPAPGVRVALGVHDGDELPEIATPSGVVPAARIDLSVMDLGRGPDGRPSWTERALRLRDEFGPFRLAYLEALLRVADVRASAREAMEVAP